MEKEFEKLLIKNKRYIHQVIRKMNLTNNVEELKDLFQLGYISFYKAYKNYNPEKNDNFLTFSGMVIVKDIIHSKNKIINNIYMPYAVNDDTRKIMKTISLSTPLDEDLYLEDTIGNEDNQYELNRSVLSDYLSTLKQSHQELIIMHYFKGMSIKDIAEQKEKTYNNIQSLLGTIIKKIKEDVANNKELRNQFREML